MRTALAVILRDLAQSLAINDLQVKRGAAAPAIFEDTKVDGFMPTQWPRLSADIHDEVAKLATHEFNRSYVPGRDVYLYLAGSSGLSRLAKSLQLPIFKLGLTAQPDLLTRQNELRADAYAASTKEDGAYSSRDGFDDWKSARPSCESFRRTPSSPPCRGR